MPRKKIGKKYYFLYKTTNIQNNKYYIGIHTTNNIRDGYLGSGRKLTKAIRKYGKENFKIEILEYFDSKEALYLKEKEIVNSKLLLDPMCMNLKIGGEGGWHIYANLGFQEKLKDPEYKKEFTSKSGFYKLHKENKALTWKDTYDWSGKKHKEETIQKMRESKKSYGIGENNSQYGTIWITNGLENKKIKKEDSIPQGWYTGRKKFTL